MSGGRRGAHPPLIDSRCLLPEATRNLSRIAPDTARVTTDSDLVDDLATLLFGLRVEGRSTALMTAHITRQIVGWAAARGWSPRTEARVSAPSSAGEEQLGFVDVIVRRGAGLPDLAIEIDSADKPWSVDKLRHAAGAGMRAIWVRWGDDEWAGVYEDIDVIQLQLLRRADRRQSADRQLQLWG